jgi:hypothetical protein
VSYIGNQPTKGQFRKLTDISGGFNGVATSFTLSVPPGTAAFYVTPTSTYSLIISVNNVIKNPDTDYTVSGYTITFTTPPTAGHSFFGIVCGDPLNGTVPADGTVTLSKLSPTGGSVGQSPILNSSLQFTWATPGATLLTANNTVTGSNTFSNTTGQIFTTGTSTQDGIVLKGNANGTTSNRVTITPANLTGNQTLTLPDASGTVTLTGANNAFTGANTFYNATGQTFGTATSTNDGIVISGRAGGASSYRATIIPGTLSASRTLTIPDVTGNFVTTGDTGTVTNTMLAGSISNAKLQNSTITINGSPISLGGSVTVSGAVTNSVTFDNTGAGAASGSSFNGSSALTVSFNTIGAIGTSGNNAFTGANTFYNSSGQTFGTTTSTQDGIVISGRAGGTLSYRSTLIPGTLSANRTLTLPDVTGTLVTTGDTGTVTSTMIADGTIVNADISATAAITVSKLLNGTARQVLQTNAAGTVTEWTSSLSLPGTLDVTGATTHTNSITLNAQNQLRFADADSSNYVAFRSATTVTSNVLWTLPATDGGSNQFLKTDGAGTLSWGSAGGDVVAANNNAFTGANTFYNATGQTFGTATSTQDGIVLQGRAGGTTSLRVTIVPGTLTLARTLTLPNVSGTVITTGDTGTVTNTMLANSSVTINGTAVSLGGTATINTSNAVTFNNLNAGAASGSTFNGSSAITVSTNTIGAPNLTTSNTFTGANTFLNSTGQVFRNSATTDGVYIQGNGVGSLGWSVTLRPLASGLTTNRVILLPNVDGTVVTTGDTGTVTSTMIADGAIVNADINASAAIAGTKISPNFGSQDIITTGTIQGTPKQATSQTVSVATSTISIGSIPSWAKRVTIIFDALSCSGADNFGIRVGTSGGFATTGYAGSVLRVQDAGAISVDVFSTNFVLAVSGGNAATSVYSGHLTLSNLTGNTWVIGGTYSATTTSANARMGCLTGSISLGGALTQVQLVDLTSTFDAGTLNIFYEG